MGKKTEPFNNTDQPTNLDLANEMLSGCTKLTISTEQLACLFGVGRPTIRKWLREGRMPMAMKQNSKTIRWAVGTIRQFLQEQLAAAQATTPTEPATVGPKPSIN